MYSVSGSVMKGNQKAKLRPTFDWLQIIFFGLIMFTWKTQLKPPLSSRYHSTVQFLQMSDREPIFTSCNTLRCWGSTGAPLSEVRPPKKFLPDLCLFTFTISCTHFFFRTRFKLPALPLARPKKKKKENTAPGKWDLLSLLL